MNEWPEYFPANTPPEDSVPTSGLSFRLVNNNPPQKSDFISTHEEFKNRTYKTTSDFINACGTSHFALLNN